MNKKRSSNKKKNGASTSKGFGGALRELQANSFPYAGTIRPGNQSPQRIVIQEAIMKPDYAEDGKVRTIHFQQDFKNPNFYSHQRFYYHMVSFTYR